MNYCVAICDNPGACVVTCGPKPIPVGGAVWLAATVVLVVLVAWLTKGRQ